MEEKTELIIDPEFETYLDKLTAAEYLELEKSLIKNGFESKRGKIITWRGIILDGHNRYKLCRKHGIQFEQEEASGINTRDEAKIWIIKNQLSRRNLPQDRIEHYIGEQYNLEKKLVTNESGKNQHTEVNDQSDHQPKDESGTEVSGKSYHQPKNKKTEEKLAEEYNISPKTVRNNAKKAEATNAIGEVSKEAKEKILNGSAGISKQDLIKLADAPKEEIEAAAKAIEEGNYVSAKPKKEAKPKPETKADPEPTPNKEKDPEPEPLTAESPKLNTFCLRTRDILNLVKVRGIVYIAETESSYMSECEPEAVTILKDKAESAIKTLTDFVNLVTQFLKDTKPEAETAAGAPQETPEPITQTAANTPETEPAKEESQNHKTADGKETQDTTGASTDGKTDISSMLKDLETNSVKQNKEEKL